MNAIYPRHRGLSESLAHIHLPRTAVNGKIRGALKQNSLSNRNRFLEEFIRTLSRTCSPAIKLKVSRNLVLVYLLPSYTNRTGMRLVYLGKENEAVLKVADEDYLSHSRNA